MIEKTFNCNKKYNFNQIVLGFLSSSFFIHFLQLFIFHLSLLRVDLFLIPVYNIQDMYILYTYRIGVLVFHICEELPKLLLKELLFTLPSKDNLFCLFLFFSFFRRTPTHEQSIQRDTMKEKNIRMWYCFDEVKSPSAFPS